MSSSGYSILIIDKSPEERTKLTRLLSPQYKIEIATNATEGVIKVSQNDYTLILMDYETLGLQVESFVNLKREKNLPTKLALMTKLHLEEYICFIRRWEITNILPKRADYPTEQILLAIENLINPELAFGLRRYLPTTIKSEFIRTREDKQYVVSKVINTFGAFGCRSAKLNEVRLVLEEMINNATYHGFRDSMGKPKYNPQSFSQLAENEMIKVDYGCLSDIAGFAVSDNQGTLTPKQIIDSLCRQYDKEGVYDHSGRGLFLSRRFSDTIIFNLRRNQLTQIVALFFKEVEKTTEAIKPFYINYVE